MASGAGRSGGHGSGFRARASAGHGRNAKISIGAPISPEKMPSATFDFYLAVEFLVLGHLFGSKFFGPRRPQPSHSSPSIAAQLQPASRSGPATTATATTAAQSQQLSHSSPAATATAARKKKGCRQNFDQNDGSRQVLQTKRSKSGQSVSGEGRSGSHGSNRQARGSAGHGRKAKIRADVPISLENAFADFCHQSGSKVFGTCPYTSALLLLSSNICTANQIAQAIW